MKRNNKKGFTIVELTIVIAVIAILAAVLIPTFSSVVDKANQSADVQLVRQANVVLQAATADGSSLTKAKAEEELKNNSITLGEASRTGNVFYYLEDEGRFVIFNTVQGSISYPEELATKLPGWKPSSTISYNVNGGSGVSNSNYQFSDTITLPSTTLRGYDFKGWKLETTTGSWSEGTYNAGQVINAGQYGDISLVAQWEPMTFTIRYHLNDGTDRILHEQTVKFKENMKIKDQSDLDTLKRDGYSFNGWYCIKDNYRGWCNNTTGWAGCWIYATPDFCIGCHGSEYNVLDLYADWKQN